MWLIWLIWMSYDGCGPVVLWPCSHGVLWLCGLARSWSLLALVPGPRSETFDRQGIFGFLGFWPPLLPPLPGSPPPPSPPPPLPLGPPPLVPSDPCYGCARQGHLWRECPALKGQCRKCARTGHEEGVCDIHKEDQRRFEAVHGRLTYAALARKHEATVILLDGSVVLWFHGLAWPRSSLALVPGPRSNRIS